MNIPRTGTMTIAIFRKLWNDGMADFEGAERSTNERKARCRVCRFPLLPGDGYGYNEFMVDGYRYTVKYICVRCFDDMRGI